MKNLVIFLARYAVDASDARYKAMSAKDLKEFKEIITLKFPIIQGLSNQLDIKKISDMEIDYTKIREEVDSLIKDKS